MKNRIKYNYRRYYRRQERFANLSDAKRKEYRQDVKRYYKARRAYGNNRGRQIKKILDEKWEKIYAAHRKI